MIHTSESYFTLGKANASYKATEHDLSKVARTSGMRPPRSHTGLHLNHCTMYPYFSTPFKWHHYPNVSTPFKRHHYPTVSTPFKRHRYPTVSAPFRRHRYPTVSTQ